MFSVKMAPTYLGILPLENWPSMGQNLYGMSHFIVSSWYILAGIMGVMGYIISKTIGVWTGSLREVFDKVKKCDLLLIDDIGAETVTSWNRDEVLGTILQYRMQESLPTFFTSYLSLKELEVHLAGNDSEGKIKARRIIERIKYLTDNITMIAENRRK